MLDTETRKVSRLLLIHWHRLFSPETFLQFNKRYILHFYSNVSLKVMH